MKQQYWKIASIVVGVLLVIYVFFPVSGHENKMQGQPEQAFNSAQQLAKPATRTHKSKPRKQSSAQDRINQQQTKPRSSAGRERQKAIKPDITLRQAQRHTRSGPPSKMYGGL
jgi:hypothetical protein